MKKRKAVFTIMIVILLFAMCGGVFGAFVPIKPTFTPDNSMTSVAVTIIGTLKWVGYAIAVGMLVYIGIKYVMASANEKADLKQSLVKYFVGAIIIVFAVTIADWVFNLNGGTGSDKSSNTYNGVTHGDEKFTTY